MNDLNECERCAAEVNVSETLCTDCTRSVPMFEQSTSFNSVLDMLIQAEEGDINGYAKSVDVAWDMVTLELTGDLDAVA